MFDVPRKVLMSLPMAKLKCPVHYHRTAMPNWLFELTYGEPKETFPACDFEDHYDPAYEQKLEAKGEEEPKYYSPSDNHPRAEAAILNGACNVETPCMRHANWFKGSRLEIEDTVQGLRGTLDPFESKNTQRRFDKKVRDNRKRVMDRVTRIINMVRNNKMSVPTSSMEEENWGDEGLGVYAGDQAPSFTAENVEKFIQENFGWKQGTSEDDEPGLI